MKKLAILDFKYSIINIFFYASFSAIMGFASVYLLSKGASNSIIGLVLALVSIFSALLQPIVASIADKSEKIDLKTLIIGICLIIIILGLGVTILKDNLVIILFLFTSLATLAYTLTPLLTALAFFFEKFGFEINFGLGRGLGSMAYAVVSFLMGYIVKDFGTDIIPISYIIFNILLAITVKFFSLDKKYLTEVKEEEVKEKGKDLSLMDFVKTYKKFMVFILGTAVVFFTHTLINNFLIHVFTSVQGDESHMGLAMFIGAIVELPTMSLFNRYKHKLNAGFVLKVSSLIFLLKHTLTYFAINTQMIYIAQVLQFGGYGLYIPASVYYVNKIIKKEDLVKGQSMVSVAITGIGVLANLLGGYLIDSMGIKSALLIGIFISAFGLLIVCASIENENK